MKPRDSLRRKPNRGDLGPGLEPQSPRAEFIVVKMGIYLQDVFGPFKSRDSAIAFARAKAQDDVDDYHQWEVRPLVLEGLYEPDVEILREYEFACKKVGEPVRRY